MSTKKISALSTGTTANATDKIPIERSGNNYYVTPDFIKTFIGCYFIAQAKTSADHTYASGDTRLNYDTVVSDPLSTITTGGSWHWTAPVTGGYLFIADEHDTDGLSTNWAVADTIKTYLYKSTSTYLAQLGYRAFDVATTYANQSDAFTNGMAVAALTAADQCHIDYRNLTASNRKLYAGARLTILRIY